MQALQAERSERERSEIAAAIRVNFYKIKI